jgi:hypothetical protein
LAGKFVNILGRRKRRMNVGAIRNYSAALR